MAKSSRKKRAPAAAKKQERGRASERTGARPFWSGTISFGLVSVPVDLFPSTRSAGTAMRMLAPDGAPLQRRYASAADEQDVEWEQLVRGYEVAEDEHVTISDEELESVAPRKSRDIDLRVFVDIAELDPFLFERAYVLTPGGDSTKPYRLLAEVMEREGKAGVATFVMRDKEYLVAILARAGILWAETLRFASELRTPEQVGLGEPLRAPKKLVDAFSKAISDLKEETVDRAELTDERLERLRTLVESKRRKGKDVIEAPRAPAKGKQLAVVDDAEGDPPDLFETIRRSLSGKKPARGNDHAQASDDLDRMNKSELYELAQARDIAGRSAMTKAELVVALGKDG